MNNYIWVLGILIAACAFFWVRTWVSGGSKAEADASYQVDRNEYMQFNRPLLPYTQAEKNEMLARAEEQLGTQTGRFSCAGPNYSNVPPVSYPLDPSHPHWPAACENCPYNEEPDGKCHCV